MSTQDPEPILPKEITEMQRQLILLALAELALSRPGFDWTISELVKQFGDADATLMWEEFKAANEDHVRESHAPIGVSFSDAVAICPRCGGNYAQPNMVFEDKEDPGKECPDDFHKPQQTIEIASDDPRVVEEYIWATSAQYQTALAAAKEKVEEILTHNDIRVENFAGLISELARALAAEKFSGVQAWDATFVRTKHGGSHDYPPSSMQAAFIRWLEEPDQRHLRVLADKDPDHLDPSMAVAATAFRAGWIQRKPVKPYVQETS